MQLRTGMWVCAKWFPEVTAVFGVAAHEMPERLLSYCELAQAFRLCRSILILELNGINQASWKLLKPGPVLPVRPSCVGT